MDKCIYDNKPIGLWGQWHKRYLQEHKKSFYTMLLIGGKRNTYLADINTKRKSVWKGSQNKRFSPQGIT